MLFSTNEALFKYTVYLSTVYHTMIQIIFQLISTNIRSLVEHRMLIWIKNIFVTSENIDFTLLFWKKKKEQTEQTKVIFVVPAWTQIRDVACPASQAVTEQRADHPAP